MIRLTWLDLHPSTTTNFQQGEVLYERRLVTQEWVVWGMDSEQITPSASSTLDCCLQLGSFSTETLPMQAKLFEFMFLTCVSMERKHCHPSISYTGSLCDGSQHSLGIAGASQIPSLECLLRWRTLVCCTDAFFPLWHPSKGWVSALQPLSSLWNPINPFLLSTTPTQTNLCRKLVSSPLSANHSLTLSPVQKIYSAKIWNPFLCRDRIRRENEETLRVRLLGINIFCIFKFLLDMCFQHLSMFFYLHSFSKSSPS